MNISFIVSEDTTPEKLRELLAVCAEFSPTLSAGTVQPNPRNLTGRRRMPDLSKMGPLERKYHDDTGKTMSLPAGTSPEERENQAKVRLAMHATGISMPGDKVEDAGEEFAGDLGEVDETAF